MPDGGASLFAAIGSALGTSGAAAGGTAAVATGAGATGAGAAGALGSAVLAGGAGTTAGLTAAEIAALAGAGASVTGTGAQLLSEKPKPDAAPKPATRDMAQEEADRLSSLYRKRGRGAALLTAGGAAGDTSSPNLGSAALLGA